jgi:hypothetical protein
MAKTDKTVQEAIADINDSENVIYLPDHDGKIAELAYYKAETRGFAPGANLMTDLRRNKKSLYVIKWAKLN